MTIWTRTLRNTLGPSRAFREGGQLGDARETWSLSCRQLPMKTLLLVLDSYGLQAPWWPRVAQGSHKKKWKQKELSHWAHAEHHKCLHPIMLQATQKVFCTPASTSLCSNFRTSNHLAYTLFVLQYLLQVICSLSIHTVCTLVMSVCTVSHLESKKRNAT